MRQPVHDLLVTPAAADMSPDAVLRCDAILFDLDGVLVDSAECVERSWRRWAGRHGLDAARVLEVAHGRRTLETVRMVAPHLDARAEAGTLEERECLTTEGVYEIAGARELLQRLPAGRWAVVTSGIRAVATLRLRYMRLPEPAVLVCADEIERGKPDPEGYLTAARRLGVPAAACVVVEDAPPGLEAARAAGMRSIAVEGTYGANALAGANYRIPSVAAMRVTVADGTEPLELHLQSAVLGTAG